MDNSRDDKYSKKFSETAKEHFKAIFELYDNGGASEAMRYANATRIVVEKIINDIIQEQCNIQEKQGMH